MSFNISTFLVDQLQELKCKQGVQIALDKVFDGVRVCGKNSGPSTSTSDPVQRLAGVFELLH